MSTTSEALQKAIALHRAGNVVDADRCYRAVLAMTPDNFDALHYLGMLEAQRGRGEEALRLLDRALNVNPRSIEAHLSHANVLKALGRLEEALGSCERALELKADFALGRFNRGNILLQLGRYAEALDDYDRVVAVTPDNAAAWYNRGNLLQLMKRHEDALASYERVVALMPDNAAALYNRGVALQELKRYREALTSYERALFVEPGDIEVLTNRGITLYELGRYQEALTSYDKALAIKPDFAEALNNRANVLLGLKRPEEALASCDLALAIRPDYVDALNHRGSALSMLSRHEEALASCDRALALDPGFVEALNNRGSILRELRRPEEARKSCEQAIAIRPDYADAHYNLGNALQDHGKFDEAIASYRKALSCKPDHASAYSNLLFLQAQQALLDPPAYLALARGWEKACVPANEREAARNRTFQRTPLAGRRLRVGYVSGDYRQHAVSYFVEQLFAHHDRARIELFAYSTNGQRDDVTVRFAALAEHWVPVVGLSDEALSARIEADNIDVLIDLSGHTGHNRLGVFARRAAPVQAYYLGYFASTGLTEMDYWIGDEILTPAETDGHFREQVWRLPRTCVSYNGTADAPLTAWRPAADGAVWVGSFNNLHKLTPATLALWAKVLHALPEGRLLLKTTQLADAGNRQRILDAFSARGVASNRVELQDGSSTPGWAAHMAYYNRLDIALDPVGAMGGVTTSCDALWMAVPLVTLLGDRVASRMTASLVDAIGHPEWIARSEAEYIDKVVALARDVELRMSLRATQRDRMGRSPLCNGRDLAIHLENAYSSMFEQWMVKDPSSM